jgi:inosine-5'-monophosphate dehydrogenase
MIRLNEMAKRLNVSVKTLQRWDREGILIAKRTPTDRRYYTEDQYLEYIGSSTKSKRKTIAYVRVSSANQKDDLRNQITFIRNYVNAKGEILDDVIEDIGSGLNYDRKHWNDLLLNQIPKGEIEKIYITYKDRFVRFGFDWFERFCNHYNCEIVIINNPDTSPQKELVDDLISIIHVFSCRIYGLRKYKKDISLDESL